jgi:hemerythrin-like domain-containing protein
MDLVEHHVEEEEGEVFPRARKALSAGQASQIAEDFRDVQREAFGDVVDRLSEFDLREMTKDELIECARDLDIEVSSSMTKDELVGAMSGR